MFLEELTGSVILENNKTECKGHLNRNDTIGWLKIIASSSDHFTLSLPDLTYISGVQDTLNPEIIFIPPEHGSIYDKEILSFCYYQARIGIEIVEHLGISDSTHFRKIFWESLFHRDISNAVSLVVPLSIRAYRIKYP